MRVVPSYLSLLNRCVEKEAGAQPQPARGENHPVGQEQALQIPPVSHSQEQESRVLIHSARGRGYSQAKVFTARDFPRIYILCLVYN